jgi:hypothetical protein
MNPVWMRGDFCDLLQAQVTAAVVAYFKLLKPAKQARAPAASAGAAKAEGETACPFWCFAIVSLTHG